MHTIILYIIISYIIYHDYRMRMCLIKGYFKGVRSVRSTMG